jgi:inorganic pyrophosphatase
MNIDKIPIAEFHPLPQNFGPYRDLGPILIDRIAHIFEHYADLESGKWVKVTRWGEGDAAMDFIKAAMLRAEQQSEQQSEQKPG